MSLGTRLKARLAEARERRPLLDHAIRTVQHYGDVKGSLQAGAVTYFAFISFFPLLALAFAVIGYAARIYPDAEEDLVKAINAVLPGLVGEGEGEVSLDTIRDSAPSILSVGLLIVLYSGLGWLSSMRAALLVMFEMPQWEHPSFVFGKLRDLFALVTLGLILMLSVGITGVVHGLSEQILDELGLAADLGLLLGGLAVVVGVATTTVLFFALFRVLAQPDLPRRAIWSGAFLGAIAFEILKQASQLLLQATAQSPAFQAFGIALILVVWINYFSRVVMYAAAWAFEHPAARALRPEGPDRVQGPPSPSLRWRDRIAADQAAALERRAPARWAGPFAAGGAAMLALVAVLRRRGQDGR